MMSEEVSETEELYKRGRRDGEETTNLLGRAGGSEEEERRMTLLLPPFVRPRG